MAYIPMTIGGKKYSETSLWTNNSPTSDFSAQTVNLSDSISDYKYIAIDYCYNKSNTNITSRVIYDVNDFKKAIKDSSTNHTTCGLSIEGNNNVNYARPVFYASDTSVSFGLSSTLNGSGTYAAGAIPLEILGLNELDTGKMFAETTLWTNSSPTSAFAGQTVNLSESIDNYDYIKVKFKYANGYDIFSTPIVLVSDFKTYQANSQRSGAGMGGIFDASNNMYSRCYWYVNNTSVQFSAAYRLNSTTQYNDNLIPIEISGLKFA